MKKLYNQGVKLINSAIFNSGFLLGTNYYNYVEISESDNPLLYSWREQFTSLCSEYNITPISACIQFTFRYANNLISSIALNPTSVTHIDEYQQSLSTVIPVEFWRKMEELNLIKIHVIE
jgi:D-threo-aldose 1-dehydrogenase